MRAESASAGALGKGHRSNARTPSAGVTTHGKMGRCSCERKPAYLSNCEPPQEGGTAGEKTCGRAKMSQKSAPRMSRKSVRLFVSNGEITGQVGGPQKISRLPVARWQMRRMATLAPESKWLDQQIQCPR